MMKIYSLIVSLFAFLMIAGCSSTDSDSSKSNSNSNGLAILAINTGSGNFAMLNMIDFCYSNDGCESSSDFSGSITWEGQEYEISVSKTDKHAVGVKVTLEIEEGQGIVQVVRGRSYMDGNWQEFDKSEVIYESGTLKEGDTINFTAGDTGN